MNSKKIKTAFTILIAVLIAAIFIYFGFRNYHFTEFAETWQNSNKIWLLLSGNAAVTAYIIRGIRWKQIFKDLPSTKQSSVSLIDALEAVSFGYLLNYTIPRSGEVARATYLFRKKSIPVSISIGTIVLERLIDLFFTLILLGVAFISHYSILLNFVTENLKKIQGHYNTKNFIYTPWFFFGILSILLLSGLAFLLVRKFRPKIVEIFQGIRKGLFSLKHIQNLGLFIFLSLGIWASYFCAAYFVILAIPETQFLSIWDANFLLVMGTFGMLMPASGGVGTYHIAVKMGIAALFTMYGIHLIESSAASIGLSYALISHGIQTLVTLIFGIWSIIKAITFNKKLVAESSL